MQGILFAALVAFAVLVFVASRHTLTGEVHNAPHAIAAHHDDPEKNMKILGAIGLRQLRDATRDSGSFEVIRTLGMSPLAVCYDYRARNSYGGTDIGHAVIDDSGLRAVGTSGFITAWNRHCGGRTGINITQQVEVVLRLSGAE